MKKIWEKFTDQFGATFIHPQFIMLRLTHQAITEAKKVARGKLVDIGCGHMPYRRQLLPQVESYTGVDHPQVHKLYRSAVLPDVLADAHSLPFKDGSFDIALMLQVLEYLAQPQQALTEAYRILKIGGVLILSAPFMYPIHDAPYDRNRFTKVALADFLKQAHFSSIKIVPQGTFWDFWLLSLLVFLFKRLKLLQTRKTFLSTVSLALLLLVSPVLVILINSLDLILNTVSKLFPPYPNEFPLNFLVIAKKKN